MNLQYDENLSQNKFLKQLQIDHPILLETAPLENWTICIPRNGNIHEEKLKEPEYLLAHILISNDDPKIGRSETFFTNLVGNNLKLLDKKIYISDNSGDWSTFVTILFEEIFYTKDTSMKYKVWCIDGPLCIKIDNENLFGSSEKTESNLHSINCLKDAEDLIWAETRSKYLVKKIDHTVEVFTKNISKKLDSMSLVDLRSDAKGLVQHCYDILLLNKKLRKKCSNDSFFHKTIELAAETYTINLVYSFLFNAITICSLEENQNFNKTLKNLSEISLTHFQVDSELIGMIPYVKIELAKIGNFTNVLDKINCLKRALNAISSSQLKNDEIKRNISVDEILQIFVFAIIKTGGTHWITNLIFLKEFNFFNSELNNDEVGAESFLITTLEAAILFIKNEIGVCWKDRDYSTQTTLNNFFQKIINESENEVIEIIKKHENTSNGENKLIELCHPLCDCEKCQQKVNENILTVNSANSNGITPLHLSAMRGLSKMLNLLIALGADVGSRDNNNWTALHHAAATGNQNTLLLLLHAGADINAETIEKNSPLHLASLNGHEGCTKAILYFSDHMKITLDLNLQNNLGNTALHFASKFGFIAIIESLLEYGIRTDIQNKLNQTSIDYAHNSKVLKLIKNSFIVIESDDISQSLNSLPSDLNESLSSLEMEDKSTIDKVINAISVGDTNLAQYYIGIDNITLPIDPNEINLTNKILNLPNSDGITALHASSYYGNYVLIAILLKIGADPTLKTKSGQTCLHLACQNEKSKSIEALLNYSKINIINITDSNKDCCLNTAVKTGNSKIVETILRFKPDLSIRNIEGKRPIDIAKCFLYLNIVKLLEEAEEAEDPISDVKT